MDTTVLLAVLAAAVLHATWNALIKSSSDRLLSMALQDSVMWTICLVIVLFLAPLPHLSALPYMLVSAGLLIFYRVFLLKAYRYGDFSRSYPIARGVAPLLVAGAGLGLGDDVLSLAGYAGVLLVSLGIASLIFSKKYGGGRKLDRGLFYALATGCVIAAYSVIDSRGVRIAGTVAGFYGCLVIMSSIWLPAYVVITRGRQLIPAMRVLGGRAAISGSCSVAAYMSVLWAFNHASAVQVVALRETSVIFGAAIGAYAFGEGFGVRRVISAAMVAFGVIILQFYG